MLADPRFFGPGMGYAGGLMTNLNPLKYCFHGQHSRPRATFRTLPGVRNKRAVCAECYEKIMADRRQKKRAGVLQP
jgi:hypothetical protein